MHKKPRNALWWGTLTLTGAALASRGLGLIYRMLLARFLGSEGLGFFQMIFPLYVALVTLSVAGTPVAVSQILAEGKAPARHLMRVATAVVLATSLPLVLMVVVGRRPLALVLYHDSRFEPWLLVLAPALVAVALSSVIRGYFIGRQDLRYPAASQVLEQLVRVLIVFWLLDRVHPLGAAYAPLIAVGLIPLGELVSLGLLAYGYWQTKPPPAPTPAPPKLARTVLRLSLPVTASRLLASLFGVIEASLIPERLVHSGLSPADAVSYFGQLTGMALPLILFPTALTVSLSTNLIPAIAAALHDRPRVHQYIVDALKATALLTIPVTFVLLSLGLPLDDLLFHATVPQAVFLPLVVGGFFLYFDIALAGVLRGLGRTDLPLWNDLLASGFEILLIWGWAGRPGQGYQAVAVAVAAGFIASAGLNLWQVIRLTHVRIPWFHILGKPIVAAFPLLLVLPVWQSWASTVWHNHALSLLSSVVLAGLGYLVTLYVTGTRPNRLV